MITMRNIIKCALVALVVTPMLMLNSCKSSKYEMTGGKPTIKYIRPMDVEKKDSLLEGAYLQAGLTIVGENLTSIKEMYFNDQKAVLNTSYITYNTLLVNVPKSIPTKATNKIYMHTRDGEVVEYPFRVLVPAPVVKTMSNEWEKVGSEVTLIGEFFVTYDNDPLVVTFTGYDNSINVPVTTFKSISQNAVTFTIPAEAEPGRVEVHTAYGDSKSLFYFHDDRGMICDFEGPEVNGHRSDSRTGIAQQGWNMTKNYFDVDGVDGTYVEVTGEFKQDGESINGWVEPLKLSFWCGNWGGDPMSIKTGAGAPLRNVFEPGYFANPDELTLKFELCIPSTNPWACWSLQAIFANYTQCCNDSWQNNVYIKASANASDDDKKTAKTVQEGNGGTEVTFDLCRGLWTPWLATGSYDTGGKWVTVSMPLSEFVYNQDGTLGKVKLTEKSFDSFVLWVDAGGAMGKPCTPILRYDNIRVVPNLK